MPQTNSSHTCTRGEGHLENWEYHMETKLRIVGLATELTYPEITIDAEGVSKLYESLSKYPVTAYDRRIRLSSGTVKFYRDLGKNARSEVSFSKDKLSLVQTGSSLRVIDFEAATYRVGINAMQFLGIPHFSKQTISHRSVYQPRYARVGRTYVLDRICRQEDKLESSFKRPIKQASLQLTFSGTRENPGKFKATIDSQLLKPEDVTIDIQAIFSHKRIDRAALEPASRNFEYVEEYVLKRLVPYLEIFDVPMPKFEPTFQRI